MSDVENTVRVMLLGVAAGGMVASAIGLYRAPTRVLRWTGVLFCLGVVAYAIQTMETLPHGQHVDMLPLVCSVPVTIMTVTAVGWFYLFVRALFDDRCALNPWAVMPVVVLAASGVGAAYAPEPVKSWLWLVCDVGGIVLTAYALGLILRGLKSDLVEARRRLRAPFLIVISVHSIFLLACETWRNFTGGPDWYPLVNAISLAVVSLFAAGVFLEARADLFGEMRPVTPAPAVEPSGMVSPIASIAALDRAAQADLDRLEKLMGCDEVWREEGLTIASLALKANMPETHLRRLINDHLGHRNFPSYVNARRIEAAKSRLQDPNEARTSISTIAFDLGFGSLGPFNRAFREATGKAPSEWRRDALSLPPAAGPDRRASMVAE